MPPENQAIAQGILTKRKVHVAQIPRKSVLAYKMRLH